jgi:NitT/TauT family transport system substrate-binding protein
MPMTQTRRRFLTTAALAGAAGFVHIPRARAAEGALETTTVRLPKSAAICSAPGYVADELLRAEGFTDIRYVDLLTPTAPVEAVARGKIDFGLNYASNYVTAIDAGEPIMLLAGVMVGCYELFGGEGIRSIADLKGKSVGVQGLGSTGNVLVTMMAPMSGSTPPRTSIGSPTPR